MSIDIESETLIHFSAAAREFPGRPVCMQTMHRWRLHGVRGVRLEAVLIGGLRYTSLEAIARFIRAQNVDDPQPATTAKQRARQSAAARRELEQMGI